MIDENNRTFIVGDIHGCLGMLESMLAKIPWDPEKDNLIFIGDYIDRGENPKGVIDLLISLGKMSVNVHCLMGNHESVFLEYLSGEDEGVFLFNGGMSTLNSYRKNGEIFVPPDHLYFIMSLKSMLELENYYVVHAGFTPGVEIEKQTEEDWLWIREKFIFSDYDFGKKIIFGHTPFISPLIMKNKIGLDTGAVFGNKLTCMELPGEKFHYVEA